MTSGERVDVPGCDVVGGDDDVVVVRGCGELRTGEPPGAVVEVDAQRRCEARDLGSPLLDDAHRADDERRAEGVAPEVLALGRDHRDRLHRLAEAHVVGEDRADPEVAEHPQPAVAALLERKELELHRGRRRAGAKALLVVVEERGERRVERDLAELDTRLVRLETRDGADEIDDPGAGAAAVEEAKRPLDVRAAERMPLAGDADERLLGGRELRELVVGEDDVAHCEPPVEPRQLRRGEEAARAARRLARGGEVDPTAGGRAHPGGRQQDRDASLLEHRHPVAQEQADGLRIERRLVRLGGVELDPDLGEDRVQLGELADQIPARVAVAEEGEDVVVAAPQQ